MIEARGFVERRNEWRQLERDRPFIGAAARRFHARARLIPPWGDAARDRLENKDPRAGLRALDQGLDKGVARALGQLVQHVCRHDSGIAARWMEAGDIADSSAAIELQLPVCRARLVDCPRMAVDAEEAWRSVAGKAPRGAGGSRAATEIDDRAGCARSERVDDMTCDQEMNRCVEQRERRALACAVERGATRQRLPPFDIRG